MLRLQHTKELQHLVFIVQAKQQYDLLLVPWTIDLKHRKIRVNALSPGPIDTPGIDVLAQNEEHDKQLKRLITTVPMGRRGNPDDVAKVVLFLASDESSFVTGIDLCVDGGRAQI